MTRPNLVAFLSDTDTGLQATCAYLQAIFEEPWTCTYPLSTLRQVATFTHRWIGLCVDKSNNDLYLLHTSGSSSDGLYRYPGATGTELLIPPNTDARPLGDTIAIHPLTGQIWVFMDIAIPITSFRFQVWDPVALTNTFVLLPIPASTVSSHDSGFCFDSTGAIYIYSYNNNQIYKYPNGSSTGSVYVGNGQIISSPTQPRGDGGLATSARLSNGTISLTCGVDGTLYVTDRDAHLIRKVNPNTGIISLFAGNDSGVDFSGSLTVSGDGGPANVAGIGYPYFLKELPTAWVLNFSPTPPSGGLENSVRQIDKATGTITTLAGVGTQNVVGVGGPAAMAGLGGCPYIDTDSVGNIWIAGDQSGLSSSFLGMFGCHPPAWLP